MAAPDVPPQAVQDLLAEHRAEVAAAGRWLYGMIVRAMPDATVKVWKGWHGFGFHHPEAGYAVGVFPKAEDVELLFEWGVRMPDPEGLLTGEGTRTRRLHVQAQGSPPEDVLAVYVDLAVEAAAAGRNLS